MLAVSVVLLWPVAGASAQDGGVVRCDPPIVRKPEEVTPADTARGVSIDAPIRVRYTEGYFGPSGPGSDPAALITVRRCPLGCEELFNCDETMGDFVPGRVQVLGDNLFFHPDATWEPTTAYAGIARGVDENLPFRFCTGTTTDTTPPELRAIREVTSTPVEPRCDAPSGGYRIATFFPPADDSGAPPASIEYLLFQTRGAGIEEPVLRSTIRNFPTETHTMAFVLPPELAGDVICVRVAAVDGRGNVDWSDSNPDVDCVNPVQGNFFYSLCAVSAPGGSAGTGLAALPLAVMGLGALALAVRRRRGARS